MLQETRLVSVIQARAVCYGSLFKTCIISRITHIQKSVASL